MRRSKFELWLLISTSITLAFSHLLQAQQPDFKAKSFDIFVPNPNVVDWGKVAAEVGEGVLFPEVSLIKKILNLVFEDKNKGESTEDFNSRNLVKIGSVLCPTSIISGLSEGETGIFERRRISISYSIVPDETGINLIRRKLKNLRIYFSVSVEDKNPIEIRDILPNTRFVDSPFSGKIVWDSKIGISAGGDFVLFDAIAESQLTSSFIYKYSPKNLEVVSGTVGSDAFIEFQPKSDGTFTIGKIPIELSVFVPTGLTLADLSISNLIVSDKDEIIPVGLTVARIYFY